VAFDVNGSKSRGMYAMKGTYDNHYRASKLWIEITAPNPPGVQFPRDNEGKVISVGKGKVSERLVSHWKRNNSSDASTRDPDPVNFGFELTDRPAEREAELIRELKPSCIGPLRSRFLKLW
jgi:excinuclease UvrABC nuclease subunit